MSFESKAWTDDQISQLIDLHEEQGMIFREIATILGRSLAACTTKYSNVRGTRGRYNGNVPRKPKPPTKRRKCLDCRTPFDSTGNGNRLCTTCRKRIAQMGATFED